jgi:hypothetical protein
MKAILHFFKNLDAKRKAYINVFWLLCFLTVLELIFLELPLSKTLITILVCVASLAKAVVVGWVYMHLNHETKGLKVLLLFPLFVAFFYAAFLIVDSNVTESRHAHPYVGEPERKYGQRIIEERVVDDFGNPVVPKAVEESHAAVSSASSEASVSEASASASSEASSSNVEKK